MLETHQALMESLNFIVTSHNLSCILVDCVVSCNALLFFNLTVGSRAMLEGSYLVDPASSHMLVSKIKPCMSKYKQSIQ